MLKKFKDTSVFMMLISLSILSLFLITSIGTMILVGLVFLLDKADILSYYSSGSKWIDFWRFYLLFCFIYGMGAVIEAVLRTILYALFGEKIYTNKFSFDLIRWLSYIIEAIILLAIVGWITSSFEVFAWLQLSEGSILIIVIAYYVLGSLFEDNYYQALEKINEPDFEE